MRDESSAPSEEWRPVVGYEGLYEVSSCGRVRRASQPGHLNYRYPAGYVRSVKKTIGGYPALTLRKDGRDKAFLVHILVAAAFLGPRPAGWHTDHIDGVKRNARLDNLEYVTHAENMRRAQQQGTRPITSKPPITPADLRFAVEELPDDTEEQWASVPVGGFEHLYEVSTWGRIKRVGHVRYSSVPIGRITEGGSHVNGYRIFALRNAGRTHAILVHRLVLLAFVGPCPPGHVANHRDSDRSNNRLSNLEYVTERANHLHAAVKGRYGKSFGSLRQNAKLNESAVRDIRCRLGAGEPVRAIARQYTVSPAIIARIKRGEGWKHVT